MSSVDHEYYEYLMSQDKSDLAIKIMNLETSSSNNRTIDSGFESLKDAMVNDFLDDIKAKDKQLANYKEALELACVNVNCMDCCHFNCRKEPYNEKHDCIECHALGLTQKHLSKYFLDQAEKDLEEQDA